jgi:type IV secretion system protein VirB1
MSLSAATVFALAERCAPAVAAPTLSAVALAESGFNPFAINVNHGAPLARPPASRTEALTMAKALLASGANLDLGLLQINVANLPRLGLSLDDAFDPCRSLAAGATLLKANYTAVRAQDLAPQAALRTALSLYNTGDQSRGFRNGYVTRVLNAAARVSGAPLQLGAVQATVATPAWDAFGDLSAPGFVITLPSQQGSTP